MPTEEVSFLLVRRTEQSEAEELDAEGWHHLARYMICCPFALEKMYE